MLDPQTSRFWQATVLSGLMDAQSLSACWEAIPPSKREAAEHLDRRLARQAVQLKALTLWQAQQLLAGRTAGFKVDRYVLLDLIGQGGMGRVYLAQDTRLNRRVALKILSPERVNNPRAIARFQREARVGAQLQHENLVRIYDFGESNGRYFLVMEYIEGKTIGTLISEQGSMPPATAVRLTRQVALGLEHAHRKGLIHRDVNPYNILVTRDGTAKLADLGLAIDLAEEDRVTREGATVGTFDYVAPEQARQSRSADIRSDIYSLGCTLYHTLTGQVPFPNPSLPEKLFAHQSLEPTPLDQLTPGLPEGLDGIVQRMMRKSPDERYATPLQVAQALEPYAGETDDSLNHQDALTLLSKPVAEKTTSPKLSQAKAVVPHSVGAEPAAALEKTVADPEGSKTPSVAATDSGSGSGTTPEPTAPLPSSVNDASMSDPEFPLDLDLGPEPALSEGLSRPKVRSAVDQRVLAADSLALLRRLPRAWFLGLLALTVMVVVAVVLLAVVNPLSRSPVAPGTGEHPTQTADSQPDSSRDTKSASVESKPSPRAQQAIFVQSEGESERGFPPDKLFDAMQTAMGSRGWVELRNREPLRLTSDQSLDFLSARGPLIICAGPGIEPVIEIELKGSKPLLATGSGVSLKLSGLTIVVRYPGATAFSSPAPPPVILTAGGARIERCAVKVVASPRVSGCCALVSKGGVLDVDHCRFEGFDRAVAIELSNVKRTPARIQQTMIIPSPPAAQGQTAEAEWYGWGVKVLGAENALRATHEPQLILEHCTFEGAGFLDLTGTTPLEIEVTHCLVRAEALLACKPGPPPAEQILWRGEGNQYVIPKHPWIVLSASAGTPALSTGVTDLKSWLSLFPKDSSVVDKAPGPRQTKPGADPNQVGPTGNH